MDLTSITLSNPLLKSSVPEAITAPCGNKLCHMNSVYGVEGRGRVDGEDDAFSSVSVAWSGQFQCIQDLAEKVALEVELESRERNVVPCILFLHQG